jgi:hypothetical protein
MDDLNRQQIPAALAAQIALLVNPMARAISFKIVGVAFAS